MGEKMFGEGAAVRVCFAALVALVFVGVRALVVSESIFQGEALVADRTDERTFGLPVKVTDEL